MDLQDEAEMAADISGLKKEWAQPQKKGGELITAREHDLVTPIFNREIGSRMKHVRMKMNLDQSQLARLLGTTQKIISRLEHGDIKVPRDPFTLGRFKAIFTEYTSYILKGSNADKYEVGDVAGNYWKKRLKKKKEDTGF